MITYTDGIRGVISDGKKSVVLSRIQYLIVDLLFDGDKTRKQLTNHLWYNCRNPKRLDVHVYNTRRKIKKLRVKIILENGKYSLRNTK